MDDHVVEPEACSPDDYETGPEPKECPRCHVPWFGVCKACGIDMRKSVLESTTYRAAVACHGAAAPGSHRGCVCHDHHVTMDERARIVAIIERFESPMVLINRRDLLAAIDGGPTDA